MLTLRSLSFLSINGSDTLFETQKRLVDFSALLLALFIVIFTV